MGYSSDLNLSVDKTLVWTDKPDQFDDALAYNIFTELTQKYDAVTNMPSPTGTVKYFDVLYPSTNYLISKVLILESTLAINYLANATPPELWRVAFEVTGYEETVNNITTFVGTALTAYIGTPSTIYFDTPNNTWKFKTNTVKVILVEGGDSSLTKKIDESNPYSYLVSMAGGDPNAENASKKRGLVVSCWDSHKVEHDMKSFGFFAVQHPVGKNGNPGGLDDNGNPIPNSTYSNPLICVHNTQIVNSVSTLSSNFYYSVIREKFIDLPTQGKEKSTFAHATADLLFTQVTSEGFVTPDPNITFNNNNTNKSNYMWLGNNLREGRIPLGSKIGRGLYSSFNNSPATDSRNLYIEIENQDNSFFKDDLRFVAPQQIAYFDPTTQRVMNAYKITMIYKTAGEEGNNIEVKIENARNTMNVIGGTPKGTGFVPFSGGGLTSTKAYASIRFNSIPYVDKSGSTINNDWVEVNGVRFTFIDSSQSPAQRQVRIGTGPNAIKDTINNLVAEIYRYKHPFNTVANYMYSTKPFTTQGGWGDDNYFNIEYTTPGIDGNNFTIMCNYTIVDSKPTMEIQKNTDGISYNNLIGGTGWYEYGAKSVLSTEISDQNQLFGSMIYPFPKTWDAPVTTDHDEYILEFPFGFCTEKLGFAEELDMIAVSKGMAYQALQEVPITVYGGKRKYTALTINKDDFPNNPIRFFILTEGGNTKPISSI